MMVIYFGYAPETCLTCIIIEKFKAYRFNAVKVNL